VFTEIDDGGKEIDREIKFKADEARTQFSGPKE
jgi:hypothetical protein